MPFKLIHNATGNELKPGGAVTTFRGEPVTLNFFEPPRSANSSGRVYCTIDGDEAVWYPSVIDCTIIQTKEEKDEAK